MRTKGQSGSNASLVRDDSRERLHRRNDNRVRDDSRERLHCRNDKRVRDHIYDQQRWFYIVPFKKVKNFTKEECEELLLAHRKHKGDWKLIANDVKRVIDGCRRKYEQLEGMNQCTSVHSFATLSPNPNKTQNKTQNKTRVNSHYAA